MGFSENQAVITNTYYKREPLTIKNVTSLFLFKETKITSTSSIISSSMRILARLYIPEEFEDPDDLTDQELTEGVTEFIEDILQKPEGIAEIDKTYGEGTASGLMDAIHNYKGFVIYEDDDESSDEEILK